MKKIYIPYIVFAMLTAILFILKLSNAAEKTSQIDVIKPITEIKQQSNHTKTNKNDIENYHYMIKAVDNEILLLDEKNNVINKLNIDYNSLRSYDRNLFLNGIKKNSINEVYQLVEDFSN